MRTVSDGRRAAYGPDGFPCRLQHRATVVRVLSVSSPSPSNRACGSPAHGSPTSFTTGIRFLPPVPVGSGYDDENATVVRSLLADLVARGLDATGGLLVVIDGAKALASAVRRVFGDHALIQRCTVHKRRNVTDHLPKDRRTFVDRRLAKAFNDADPERGLRAARALARQLETEHPDAAASLREGLEQMFTVRRLGVSDRLARTLSTTNAIESMISVARDTTRNVKHWRDGTMIKRWCAAGMLNAERSFRRLKGHKGHARARRRTPPPRPTQQPEQHTRLRYCPDRVEVGSSPNFNTTRDMLFLDNVSPHRPRRAADAPRRQRIRPAESWTWPSLQRPDGGDRGIAAPFEGCRRGG